ncbi:MAG: universal stress protein [Acidimicrobiia bacterium]
MASTDRDGYGPVIVPVDGTASTRGLVPGAAFAQRTGADLLVVSAVVDGSSVVERERDLKEIFAATGLAGAVMVSEDGDAAELVTESVTYAADAVVCVATREPGDVPGSLLGRTAAAVIRAVDVPLILVGPRVSVDGAWRWNELALCIEDAASDAALPFAADWAAALGVRLRLVHVLDRAKTLDLRSRYPQVHFDDEGYVRSMASDLIASRSNGDPAVETEVLYGSRPERAMAEFLERHPDTMPFVAIRGHDGWERLAARSLATRVMHESTSPVLLVTDAS